LKKLIALTLAVIAFGLWASTATAVGPKLTAPTPGLKIVQLRQFIAQDKASLKRGYKTESVYFDEWVQYVHIKISQAEIRDVWAHLRWSQRQLDYYWAQLGPVGSWLCIHHYEGSWTDPNDPFWGGLQMDRQFQSTYGSDMIRAYGGLANMWHPYDQMIVAERARRSGRGFYPWPNTARYCGLI